MAWTLRSMLKDWLTPGLIIGALAIGYRYISIQEVKDEKKDAENKALQFENPRQKVKIIEFAESDYNQIAVYEQGKQLIKQQVKIDSSLTLMDSSRTLIDKIFKQKIKDDSIKKIREIKIEKSRASRDSSQKVQARNAEIQAQTMRLILEKLEKLDSIK